MATSKSAAAYLLDPLNAPEPSQDTGLSATSGTNYTAPPSYTADDAITKRSSLSSNNPFRDSVRDDNHRSDVTGGQTGRVRAVSSHASNSPPSASRGHHRRSSSLKQRYPGDESHQPLEIIRKDSVRAHRSPHLQKRHMPGVDLIDRLDPAMGGRAYHHEGPYDAALLARNTSYNSSPIAALETSNAETIKATPAENIQDSIERHRPLDGVAQIPSGGTDRFGRTYQYEEGADLLREPGGDGPGYKRWADKDYHPDDLKGRGEPSFSLDRALQSHTRHDSPIEMTEQSRISREYHMADSKGRLDARDPVAIAGGESHYVDKEIAATVKNDEVLRRTGSLRAAGDSLKKRIGSLRRKKHVD